MTTNMTHDKELERVVMMLKNEQVETRFVEMLVDYLDENITQVEQRVREEERLRIIKLNAELGLVIAS